MTVPERRKALIHKLLKGIETGDPDAATVVDERRYIQHNPQTAEGSVGLAELFARLARSKPRVRMVRAFSDCDYVFAHMEYDFSSRRVAFEVFRFDGDKAVEHWDNIQPRLGPNPSGRTMTDGVTESMHAERTEEHRSLVRSFVQTALIQREFEDCAVAPQLIQHDPTLVDGWSAWVEAMHDVRYDTLHRVLADGSFVLTVSEGRRRGEHTAFYDLFRVEDGLIVEHWNTIEHVAPRSEWKNDNGKF